MSSRLTITCDGCGKKRTESRRHLRKEGWVGNGGRDYCLRCARDIVKAADTGSAWASGMVYGDAAR